GGHYIELDASQNVTVTGCSFTGHKDSESGNKEAINLDTPDYDTQGFRRGWTSYDCTANQNVHIVGNTFKDLEVGIGSHSYSENKPHKDIYIENNTIDGCDYCAIQMFNWENVTVRNNTMSNISPANVSTNFTFRIRGVKHPKIYNNTIINANRVAIVEWAKQNGKGTKADSYTPVKYELTTEEWNQLTTQNKLVNVTELLVQEYPVVGSGTQPVLHECTSN
ncbi:MAG: right-handed parallel beta-helix repeat-containing protein, partial [Lachnospiraceae bacterium]|nr:right-handed parallel beta-helix repeat-containing protein [Lachnospiraceae bacterium]